MKNKNIIDDKLKKKFKLLIEKARKRNLIKKHICAFDEFSVEKEEHRGQISSFVKKVD